jgi:hypothetical protein
MDLTPQTAPRTGHAEGPLTLPDPGATPRLPALDPAAGALLVADYLDRDLSPYRRVIEMTALANQVAERDAGDVLADLRTVLGARALTGEDHQRLHVLLSQLHHAHPGLDTGAVHRLRHAVTTAWAHTHHERR